MDWKGNPTEIHAYSICETIFFIFCLAHFIDPYEEIVIWISPLLTLRFKDDCSANWAAASPCYICSMTYKNLDTTLSNLDYSNFGSFYWLCTIAEQSWDNWGNWKGMACLFSMEGYPCMPWLWMPCTQCKLPTLPFPKYPQIIKVPRPCFTDGVGIVRHLLYHIQYQLCIWTLHCMLLDSNNSNLYSSVHKTWFHLSKVHCIGPLQHFLAICKH